MINKKVNEKIQNLVETKMESIVQQVLFKNIRTNAKLQREFQEIIKTSSDEVGEALTRLAREYRDVVNNPNHPKRGLLGQLKNTLLRLLGIVNPHRPSSDW